MAAQDPYDVLGVKREATPEQIRAAYRKLAKQNHPDLHPGDKQAEERFKTISAANELLSDPEKRARYDRGEIDASGQERPEQHFYRGHAEGRQGRKYRTQGGPEFSEEDLSHIFADLFGGAAGTRPRPEVRMRGADEHYGLAVDFLDAVNGATKRLTLPDGRTLDVRVPPGIEEGQNLRLKGQGGEGFNGGPRGDALIEIHIEPHRFFRRDGNDIHLDLPVTLAEAVLGAKVSVPTPSGNVTMTVPKHSDTGTRLRLRGRGVAAHGSRAAGDLYVTLKVIVGKPDAALETFLREWAPAHAADPRAGMTP
jgi:DnaJ-class molecular chaperone